MIMFGRCAVCCMLLPNSSYYYLIIIILYHLITISVVCTEKIEGGNGPEAKRGCLHNNMTCAL